MKAKKNEGLTIRRIALGELHNDPANVRTHDERNLSAIAGSLKQFGQVEPLVVEKGTGKVIGGNGRLEAMRALGWTHADVVELEMSPTQATALGIALNRTAELAAWDYAGLADLVRSLKDENFDLASIGWADHELGPLLAADFSPAEAKDDHTEDFGKETISGDAIKVTREQREVFDQAADRVRVMAGDESIADGRCLELICADYLAGKGVP